MVASISYETIDSPSLGERVGSVSQVVLMLVGNCTGVQIAHHAFEPHLREKAFGKKRLPSTTSYGRAVTRKNEPKKSGHAGDSVMGSSKDCSYQEFVT
jgi:hypothetical protein